MSTRDPLWYAALGLALLGTASCRSSEPDAGPSASVSNDPRSEPPPSPWTGAFGQPAVLLAEEIYIEGPTDLVDHFVVIQHPDLAYDAKTTEQGLRQEIRLATNVGGLEIKAQLDAWELVALRRMVVLQRPSWGPVKVRALGNAWWALADESRQRRENVLEFVGERGK